LEEIIMKNRFIVVKILISLFIVVGTLYFVVTIAKTSTERTDIVIIGSGASGMSAAIEANANGSDVVLLEKMPIVGGNTLKATAGLNGILEENQHEYEMFIDDILESAYYTNNELLVELLAYKSTDTLNWLMDLGCDLSDEGILAGHSKARTYRPEGGEPVGSEIVTTLYNTIRDENIDIRLENTAIEILQKKGKVHGVVVVDREGKLYTIYCDKIIIATGGFGGSEEEYVYYNKALKGFKTTNQPGANGDFITLTENLDVKLIDMNYIQTHPTVEPDYGVLITEAIRGNGGILVNNSGKRFTDEMNFRDILSSKMLAQKDKEVYLIFDENIRESLNAIDYYISMGLVVTSESNGGLAEMLEIDPTVFASTIERYNKAVSSGIDIDFDRENLPMQIKTNPYYAIKVWPGVHYCMGGIMINEKSQVLATDGNVIDGLYASGECTGGIHGQNRLGGNSLLDALTFGRIAGYEASIN